MRVALLSLVVSFAAACGGGSHGKSVCDNVVPAPAACMTACDATPGAPNTCPSGYHCTPDGMCDALCTPGGNECGDGYECTTDGQCQPTGACTGIACNIVDCAGMGMPETSISGTVYAPNGTLPLYGVTVYVPNADPGPLPDGAQCSRCSDQLPGDPIVQTQTDEAGHFTLMGVPSGASIPLVIQSGKWRRQITIPNVGQCTDNALQAADTRLPKNHTEGDIPKIAISTGNADALECLVRKLGIEDAEIGTAGGAQRIHLFTDKNSGGVGASSFNAGFPGGSGTFADSQTQLWNDVNSLKPYDIVILSCEGDQYPNTKPQSAMDALKAYADLGGRVFMSHWHNVWIEGKIGGGQAPAVWPSIATWNNSGTTFDSPPNGNDPDDLIDEANNSKGASFATWMQNVVAGSTRDHISISEGKQTCSAVDNTKAERWVYWPSGNNQYPQNFQFTTPNEADLGSRCGKVVFSDMHVASGSKSRVGTPYPTDCSNADMTPQEKALAFMIFDLSSCVGGLF